MANTRSTVESLSSRIEESVGVRQATDRPTLGPVVSERDASRRPLQDFGQVSIYDVIPDPNQPRKFFDESSLQQLADSIADRGQLAPLRVRWSSQSGKWLIVSGERRWRAARLAGVATVNCHFLEREPTPSEVLEEQLIENLLREDLRPVEEAVAFRDMMQTQGWTAKKLATRLRIHPSRISRALALLKLPERVQQQVDSGEISARTAYELSQGSDSSNIEQAAADAANGALTHEQTAAAIGRKRPQRRKNPQQGTRLSFEDIDGVAVSVNARTGMTYHHVEQALQLALEEVRLRLNNNVRL